MNPMKMNWLGLGIFGAFLALGGNAVAYDADTLAFYPFCDYANGTDVTLRKYDTGLPMTFTNAVDGSKYLITATTGSYWHDAPAEGSYLRVTNDVPNTYLVSGSGYVAGQPVASVYQSANLHARSSLKKGNGVKLALAGLASQLSQYDNWTVELFVKVPTAADFAEWPQVIRLDAGITYNGAATPIVVYATASSYTGSGSWRVSLGADYPIIGNGVVYSSGWMHVALVCTATELKYYVNYNQVGSAAAIAHAGPNEGQDLLINPEPSWSGFVTGLRVKKVALTADQMLRASGCPTGVVESPIKWPLEGVAGNVPLEDCLEAVGYSSEDDTTKPVLAERRLGHVHENGKRVRESGAAVRFTGVKKTSGANFGMGNSLNIPSKSFEAIVGDFTMECYMKFDANAWDTKFGEDEPRPYFGLFWLDWPDSSGRHVWDLQFRRSGGKFYPYIAGAMASWTIFSNQLSNPINTDGKWHHYALTYNYSTMTFEVFEDGQSLGTYTLADQLALRMQVTQNDGMNFRYRIGYTLSVQPFEGMIDEVRLSRRVLSPSEFILIDERRGLLFTLH